MSEPDAIHSIVTADDNLPRLNIWMLSDPEKKDLLKTILKPETLESTAALIVIDLDQPWDLKESLYKWMRFLDDTIKEVLNKLPLEKKMALQKRIERYIKGYKKLDEGKVSEKKPQENGGSPSKE
jgi:Dynein light intermediate chain (DLIC)